MCPFSYTDQPFDNSTGGSGNQQKLTKVEVKTMGFTLPEPIGVDTKSLVVIYSTGYSTPPL